MVPEQDGHVSETQYGFRAGKDTVAACSFLNDLMYYFKDQSSPLYICSLDAEKCFDRIWHAGLLYKLLNVLPLNQWMLLYSWYNNSNVKVRWKSNYSCPFRITRGTKQGSLLSPIFFNYFINDLLCELNQSPEGVCIDKHHFNHFSFADDLNLLATTVPDMQHLIDKCHNYSLKWRFSFGIKKSKVMVAGKDLCQDQPNLFLKDHRMDIVEKMEILGITFCKNATYNNHVDNRLSSCRRCMFSLQELGVTYPGLNTDVKMYLWNTMGVPTMLYGAEAINLCHNDVNKMASCQGTNVKRCLGIPKRSHHSLLSQAVNVKPIEETLNNRMLSLFHRIFNVESPTKILNLYFVSRYLVHGSYIEGSLLSKIIRMGESPVNAMFSKLSVNVSNSEDNGIIDSLRYLLYHENYVKPWGTEHLLARLLTRAF